MRYEETLREVGVWLDEDAAQGVSLLETPQGFAVNYHARISGEDREWVIFSFEDLQDPSVERERRQVPKHRDGTGYQDFLRALGHELDQSLASELLIDEIHEDVLVTYQHQTQTAALVRRKRMAVVKPAEREALLQRAHARRAPAPVKRGFFKLVGA